MEILAYLVYLWMSVDFCECLWTSVDPMECIGYLCIYEDVLGFLVGHGTVGESRGRSGNGGYVQVSPERCGVPVVFEDFS